MFKIDKFNTKLELFENDITLIVEKNKNIFDELVNNANKADKNKIAFDGEFSKVEDFKKLKKP
jgi:ribosomal protein S17E